MDEQEVELLQRLTAHKAKRIRLRKQLRLAEARVDAEVSAEAVRLDEADHTIAEAVGVDVSGPPDSAWDMTVAEWETLCDPLAPLDLSEFPSLQAVSGG